LPYVTASAVITDAGKSDIGFLVIPGTAPAIMAIEAAQARIFFKNIFLPHSIN